MEKPISYETIRNNKKLGDWLSSDEEEKEDI